MLAERKQAETKVGMGPLSVGTTSPRLPAEYMRRAYMRPWPQTAQGGPAKGVLALATGGGRGLWRHASRAHEHERGPAEPCLGWGLESQGIARAHTAPPSCA